VTGDAGQSSVEPLSVTKARPARRTRRKRRSEPKEESNSGRDSDVLVADSYFGSSDVNSSDSLCSEEAVPSVPSDKTLAPRPTHEVPVFWHYASEGDKVGRADLSELAEEASRHDGVVQLDRELEESPEVINASPVFNVRLAGIDTSGPSSTPRGIESLDLHALVDLHKELEDERKEIPGELVVHGRVAALAVPMLINFWSFCLIDLLGAMAATQPS
jgi:hypothetical protein